jgi:hypothetical protein
MSSDLKHLIVQGIEKPFGQSKKYPSVAPEVSGDEFLDSEEAVTWKFLTLVQETQEYLTALREPEDEERFDSNVDRPQLTTSLRKKGL